MKRFWTDKLDNLLRRHYPKGDLDALARRIGTTVTGVKCRAQKLGIVRKVHVRHPWTERQLNYLRRHYADQPMDALVKGTGHPKDCVYRKAAELGLEKSAEYMSELGRRCSESMYSKARRFQKGHVPANKGKKEHEFRSPEAIARCRKTQFKPGLQPHNTRPVGYESVRDGYVYMKVEGERKMVMKHRYVWEQLHGPVPDGYCVTFRDGNRLNCSPDNLCLISREDNARRNVQAETPERRAERIAKSTATRRETIRKDRIRLHWGLPTKTKLVKRW